jgi:hypothetical protein
LAKIGSNSFISRMIAQFRPAYFAAGLLLLIAGTLLWQSVGRHQRQAYVAAGRHLDFNQDVQPILASNCFSCHGPDPEMRKAGLRLDLEESAFKKRPGHPDAIVPGHPEQSELIKRIESNDPHHLMPQTSLGQAKPMKPEEIAILREWVKEGAVYRPHWAFDQPVKASLPAESQDGWARTPIDAFVLARLKREGLHPSPEADKETLIRRVTLDLTGLLPTPAEVKAFANDNSPQAYERLVDGLLARPSFGEQRARYWLDYARYADTYGLHFDNHRHIWPYRDYVIRSFNSNKPFDQFAMEQIAGDLMPAKTLDPLVASGYVRLGVSSNEGGTIPEELRVNMARERTEAYGATFMGLTVGCAVCHDHKYDPTTQKDFYSLSAFFNNIEELPFNGDRPVWAPVARIPKPQNREAYSKLLARRSELQSQLDAMRQNQQSLIERWLQSRQNLPQPVAVDKLMLRLRLDEGGGDALRNSAPRPQTASFPLGKSKGQWGETTWAWPDFRMDNSARVMLGQTGDYEWNQPFSSGGWFMLRAAPNYPIDQSGTLLSKMDTTQHNRGWDLSLEKGHLSVDLISEEPKKPVVLHENAAAKPSYTQDKFEYPTPNDLPAKDLTPSEERMKKEIPKEDKPKHKPEPPAPKDTTPEIAIKVLTSQILPVDGHWYHVLFTYDGSGKASGVKVYIDGAQVATHIAVDTLGKASIRTKAPMQLGWRYPDATPAQDTRYQDIRLYARALAADEARRLPYEDYVAELTSHPNAKWNQDQWHAVSQFYFTNIDSSARAIQSEITRLDAQFQKLSAGGDLTLVSWENPAIAYADVLTRGVYSARTERVEANTPHYLPPLPAGMPHNRLALAKWTVSPENPLTARVTVNRMWNEMFGAGLVETTEDFGIMGQRPSHPELLDWLAVEFRESGWNIKHMYKLMAMSAAYRQSAKSTPEQLQKDPKNLLLAHGPRFRMDVEMLRDVALQSGGLLVNQIGGPSVKPYQPANLWEQVSYPVSDTAHYAQDHGEALYRRSMYSYWKRMAVLPNMDAFDAPMRDAVCTRRQRTDTPLQALVTMNDVQWVEAARALAERVIQQGGQQPEQRIKLMGDILLSHDPPQQMAAVLKGSLQQMRKHYAADPKAAHALVEVGEKKHNPSIPEPELAAWTMVASEMLNLDEVVTK